MTTSPLLLLPFILLYSIGFVNSAPGQSLYLLSEGEPLEAPLSSPDELYPFTQINTHNGGAYQLLPKVDGSPGSLVVMVNLDNILRVYSLDTGDFQQFNITFTSSGSYSVLAANPVTQSVILYVKELFDSSPVKNLTIIDPFSGGIRLMPLVGLNLDVVAMDIDISRQILYVLRGIIGLNIPPYILESYNLLTGKLLRNQTFHGPDLLGADEFLKVSVNQQTGELWGIFGYVKNSTILVSINPSTFAIQKRANITNFYSFQWFLDANENQFYSVFTGGVWAIPISTFYPQLIRLIPSDTIGCYKGIWAFGASSPLHQSKTTKSTKSLAASPPILYSIYNAPFTDAPVNLNYAVQLISTSFLAPKTVKAISPLSPTYGYTSLSLISCHQGTDDYFLQSTESVTNPNQFLNMIYYDNNTIAGKQVVLSTNFMIRYDRVFALNSKTNEVIVSLYDPSSLLNPPPDYNYAFFTIDIWGTNTSIKQIFSFKNEFENLGYPVWELDESSQTILVLQTLTSYISAIQWPSGNLNWKMQFLDFNFWNNDLSGIALDPDNQKMYFLNCTNGPCDLFTNTISLVEFSYNPAVNGGAKFISTTPLGDLDIFYVWYSKTLSSVIVQSSLEFIIYNTQTKIITRGDAESNDCSACSVLRYL